jgi:hypothetical protein
MGVMTDPISAAGFVLTLTKSATEAMNALRERAQRSKDLDLKDQISRLYDIVLQLKEVINRQSDEIKRLHGQLEQQSQKPTLKQVGDTIYCFKDNEGPFCPRCAADREKLIPLLPSENWNGGIRRECTLCGEFFYEKRMNSKPRQIGGARRGGGPNSWME